MQTEDYDYYYDEEPEVTIEDLIRSGSIGLTHKQYIDLTNENT